MSDDQHSNLVFCNNFKCQQCYPHPERATPEQDEAERKAGEVLPCEWIAQGKGECGFEELCTSCQRRPAIAALLREREAEITELREYKNLHEGRITKHGTDDCPYCQQEAELAALRSRLEQAEKERKIKTRCPSCGFQTLFLSDSGEIICSWLECKAPSFSFWVKEREAEAQAALVEGMRACLELATKGWDHAVASSISSAIAAKIDAEEKKARDV